MSEAQEGTVRTRREGSVLILTLERPHRDNRITQHMSEEAVALLEQARVDNAVSGCVITGSGNVFCKGGDYLSGGATSAGRLGFARSFADFERAMSRLGKPLVAAINGDAHAGGFSLVTACDLAVVSQTATLGLPEIAHGLFPFLALAIVKDALPKKLFFDMVYRARLIDASEALKHHLVNDVVAPDAVLPLAIEMAACTAQWNRDIISLGRDLYYNTRCTSPAEAVEQSRFALVGALKAMDEST